MYIDPNNMQGIYVSNPNKVINTIPNNSNGIFSQLQDTTSTITPTTTLSEIVGRVERLELENKCLRLKIACMEGKFSQEEVTNIRKMMMSQDEASVTLANTIIENA
jgi:hypothetical protein